MLRADLHIHSSFSDGLTSVEQIVTEALAAGISVLSITDHDTLLQSFVIEDTAVPQQINYIHGVEISTNTDAFEDIHILGYGVDYKDEKLLEILKSVRLVREKRCRAICKLLEKEGISIDADALIGAQTPGASVGRMHIARSMVECSAVTTYGEAFREYIGKGASSYVGINTLSPYAAINAIHAAGGLACVAHPGLIQNDDFVRGLIDYGADCLEVFHPDHDGGERRRYENMAKEWGLFMTGGSDFHGEISHRLGAGRYNGSYLAAFMERLS